MYARSNVKPQINDVDQDKIERLYVDLRRESKQCGGVSGLLVWVCVDCWWVWVGTIDGRTAVGGHPSTQPKPPPSLPLNTTTPTPQP